MEVREFSKKSWHYWLAELGNIEKSGEDLNCIGICDYTKFILKGLIIFILIAILSVFGVYVIIETVYWFYLLSYYLELPSRENQTIGSITGLILLFLIFLGFVCKCIEDLWGSYLEKTTEWRLRQNETIKIGMIKTIYDSIKNKLCFYISVK